MITVLFLCPHNAAKSVIAAAYCERLAKAAHLDLKIVQAGTEPDQAIMPVVQDLLEHDGFSVALHQPRLVTQDDLMQADVVVTMGCNLEALSIPDKKRFNWNDIPPASADVIACRRAVLTRLLAMLSEFSRAVPA
jgi:arsenate reductase (thioredoxin)